MRSGDREVTSAAVCQGQAARASMDKKTPKKIDTQKVSSGGGVFLPGSGGGVWPRGQGGGPARGGGG